MNKIYPQLAFAAACVAMVGAAQAQTVPLDRLREIVRNNAAAAIGEHIGKGNEVGPTTASRGIGPFRSIQEVRPNQERAPRVTRAPARNASRVSAPVPAARIAPSAVVPVAAPAVAGVAAVAAVPVANRAAVSAPPVPQQPETAGAINSSASSINSSVDSAGQVSLSSLLASNTGDIQTSAAPLTDPTVYLMLQQTQGKSFYLIDQQFNEGLMFMALSAEQFERVAGFQLLGVQPDTLMGVSMSSDLHQALMARSSAAIAKVDEGVGLVKLPGGIVRIVSNSQVDSDR